MSFYKYFSIENTLDLILYFLNVGMIGSLDSQLD